VVDSVTISSLHVYCWVRGRKNFENRSINGKVMGKSRVSCFFESRGTTAAAAAITTTTNFGLCLFRIFSRDYFKWGCVRQRSSRKKPLCQCEAFTRPNALPVDQTTTEQCQSTEGIKLVKTTDIEIHAITRAPKDGSTAPRFESRRLNQHETAKNTKSIFWKVTFCKYSYRARNIVLETTRRLLGALILEIFWNVIVVNLNGSC